MTEEIKENKNGLSEDWKWKSFEDFLDYIQPTAYIVESTEYDDNYKTPVLTAGKSFIKGYTNETKGIFNSLPVIIFDDFTTANKFVNFPFKVKSSAMKILKPKDNSINIKFVFYYMQTVRVSYDTHKRYWISVFSKLAVPTPPEPIQQAIVSKIEELFSELDKGIEQLKIAQQQLKTYRQSVLKCAFEGKLTNSLNYDSFDLDDEHDLNIAAEDDAEYGIKKNQDNQNNHINHSSDKGELPKGWKQTKLGDIAKRKSLKALPMDYPDAKFIGMDCIEPHTLKPFFLYDFKEFKSAGNYFKKNQVLYGRMRPYLNKVYRAEFDGTCSGEFIILDCGEAFNPDLLKYILHAMGFVSFANSITTGDRPRISYDEIADYDILVPPIEEQHDIVQEIENRLSVADKLEESINQGLQQAEALRQSILKKAFEGKLI